MKKFFFLALMAFLWLPATTWADEANEEFDDDEQEDYDNGKIESSSVSLTYKILTVATGNDEATAGTVELEGVSESSASANLAALSIPHIIVHADYDVTTSTTNLYYYTVTGIAQDAFDGNTTLTSITIPYTVTYIGDTGAWSSGSFYNCSNLASVAFVSTTENPSQLTTIGLNAFYHCTSLTSIDIPESVTSLGANCFEGCSSITEVVLHEGITMIPSRCFYDCSALTTVWMSGSVTIYTRAFAECPSLSAFVLEGSEPATTGGYESGTYIFEDDANDVITLYVPTGSAPAYLKTNWVDDLGDTDETLQWNFNNISILDDSCDEDGTYYYATYYTDAVGEFGEDITANIVTEAGESGAITYNALNGVIPANTGLLLSTNDYSALNSGVTYYYHPYGVTEATASTDGNMLYGISGGGDITTPENCYYYMLSLDADSSEGSIGFYWGADNGGSFYCNDGKAYLAVPINDDEVAPTSYSFKKNEGDDTTGISAVESASEKTVSGIYTIQGVRVSNMNQPGLYIVDGKKVLVK